MFNNLICFSAIARIGSIADWNTTVDSISLSKVSKSVPVFLDDLALAEWIDNVSWCLSKVSESVPVFLDNLALTEWINYIGWCLHKRIL